MINDFKHGKIIFSVLVGSHAHGTNTEFSDEDYKHIYMQSPIDVINQGYKEQIDISQDETVYELGRFVSLALGGNPTMLEILFSPEDCIKYCDPLFKPLLDARDKFLAKSVRNSFVGYAYSQIKKASGLNKKMNWETEKILRKTVLDFCYIIDPDDQFNTLPLKKYLQRENKKQEHCGLAKVNHFTDCYMMYYDVLAELGSTNPKFTSTVFQYKGIVQDEDKSNDVSLSDIPKYARRDSIMFFNKNEYQRHCKEYREYQSWLSNRNTSRYVDIENHDQKLDSKNISHCVRLIESGTEIATTGTFTVRRPNAEYLNDIRKGKYSLEDIISKCDKELDDIHKVFEESSLPDTPDFDTINEIVKQIRLKEYDNRDKI